MSSDNKEVEDGENEGDGPLYNQVDSGLSSSAQESEDPAEEDDEEEDYQWGKGGDQPDGDTPSTPPMSSSTTTDTSPDSSTADEETIDESTDSNASKGGLGNFINSEQPYMRTREPTYKFNRSLGQEGREQIGFWLRPDVIHVVKQIENVLERNFDDDKIHGADARELLVMHGIKHLGSIEETAEDIGFGLSLEDVMARRE